MVSTSSLVGIKFELGRLLLLAILGGSAGLPVGIPPQEPDPIMAKVVPEQCLYCVSWVGMARPDAGSANQTEQLLAEPEVAVLIREVKRVMETMAKEASDHVSGDQAVLVQNAPMLLRTLVTHPVTVFVESVGSNRGGREPDVTSQSDRQPVQEGEPAAEPNKVAGIRSSELRGALVVNLGDEADQVAGLVWQFLGSMPPEVAKGGVTVIRGIDCFQLKFGEDAPLVTIGRKADYLIVAVGEGSFEGVLERAETPPPAWFTGGIEAFEVPRIASFAYVNVRGLSKLILPSVPGEVSTALEQLGLGSVTHVTSVTGLDETGFVSRLKITSSKPDKGIGAVIAGAPITLKDLAHIPADASVAAVVRFDARHAFQQGMKVLEGIDSDAAADIERGIERIEKPLGMELEKDLLGALGDTWTLHTAPSSGGILAGWTLTVSLKDAAQAAAVQEKVVTFLEGLFVLEFRPPLIREFRYAEHTAYTVKMPDDMAVFAVSWCLTDRHLVVAPLPQTLKSFLARKETERSLADLPTVTELVAEDNGVSAFVYQDVRSQFVAFYPFVQYGLQAFAKQIRKEFPSCDVDTSAFPSLDAIAPHLLPTLSAVRKVQGGYELYAHSSLPGANMGVALPAFAAAVVPAGRAAREASRRAQSTNNLKLIGLALFNFHDAFKSFPAAYNTDEDGKPLLSWRVHILPFVEESALYQQFHLDEPWDSPHNRKLIAQMPRVYRSPNSKAEPGKTVYLGNAGADGVFIPPKQNGKYSAGKGARLADMLDGTSNTMMAVEADDSAAVIWTKPGDLEFDPDKPFKHLGQMRGDGILGLLCDGAVRFFSRSLDGDVFNALFTKDGGERIPRF